MLNKVMLIGRLGEAPYTGGAKGTVFAKLSVATTEKYVEGEKVTSWHSVTAFGRLAEICLEYLGKGDMVYVEGRLSYRTVGEKTYTNIIAQEIKMLRGKGYRNERRKSKAVEKNERNKDSESLDDIDSDIPF